MPGDGFESGTKEPPTPWDISAWAVSLRGKTAGSVAPYLCTGPNSVKTPLDILDYADWTWPGIPYKRFWVAERHLSL
ncbi:hypothetical protein ABIE00_002944 [Arthrobacter sp. OAP107]